MKRFLSILTSLLLLVSVSQIAQAETDERAYIESVLNLANNQDQEWTYSPNADAWTFRRIDSPS